MDEKSHHDYCSSSGTDIKAKEEHLKEDSMAIVDELPNQEPIKFFYNCSKCKSLVETRYHCTVCDDFNLCLNCKEKDIHPHEMEKIGLNLDDESSPIDTKPASSQEVRKFSIQRCIESLEHAVQCKDADRQLTSCQGMKEVEQHIKACKKRASGGCNICKQLDALCCHHERFCKEAKCPVPFCFNIMQKIKQQHHHHRLQQALLLNQKMMEMNMVPSESNSASAPKASPLRSLSSTLSTSDEKPSLQKCVSFKK